MLTTHYIRQLQKFHQRSYTVILTDLSNAIRKLLEKISFHKHFKNPKRVEQGKRLAAISKEAKARKAAERAKVEECVENANMLYVTVGVLGVAGLGYGVYNFFSKKKKNHNKYNK